MMLNIKQTIHVICLLLICACSGCFKEDPLEKEVKDTYGVVTGKPYLWKADISGIRQVQIGLTPAVYENTVVIAGINFLRNNTLTAFDLDTGKVVWKQHKFLPLLRGNIGGSQLGYNQKDNIWILQESNTFYAIDLQNGNTLWEEEIEGVAEGAVVQIVGDSYYFSFGFYTDSTARSTLVKGDIYSPQYTKIMSPPIDSIQHFIFRYGGMGEPYMYEENGELHAFLQFSENVNLNESQSFSYIASYNLSTNSYDFEKTRLDDTVSLPFGQRPIMYQDIMIVNPDSELYGIEKTTGKIVWHLDNFQKNGDGIFTYAIHEDKLYAVNISGSSNSVMAIDPLTGRVLWQDKGRGGNTTSIDFLNGVLYFIDGEIYAYDTDSGELLWQLKSPENESFNNFAGFRVIPGKNGQKGKVIACTYNTAYCFEAER